MRRGAVAVAAAALLGGCGGASPHSTTPNVFAGEPSRPVDERVVRGGALYVTDGCQACHSVDGERGRARTFRNLGQRRSDAQLLRAVTHHVVLSPPSPALVALARRSADARALVDFIESVTSG